MTSAQIPNVHLETVEETQNQGGQFGQFKVIAPRNQVLEQLRMLAEAHGRKMGQHNV